MDEKKGITPDEAQELEREVAELPDNLEDSIPERVAEIIIDNNTATVTVSHLEELVTAYTKLAIIARAAKRCKSLELENLLDVILGPDADEGGADA